MGSPGVEIRAEVQKWGMTPLCPGPAQVLSATGGQTEALGKGRPGCGDVLGVLIGRGGMRSLRIRLDVAGGAILVLATVVLGLSPYLGSRTSCCPMPTGVWPHPPTSPFPLQVSDASVGPRLRAPGPGRKGEGKAEAPTSVGPQGWCLHLPGLDLTFDLSSQLGEWGVQDATSPERSN